MQWQQLTNLQKILFIIAIAMVVPFAPEFIFLADIGGIELVFGFLTLYYKPQLVWLATKLNVILKTVYRIKLASAKSVLNQPRPFIGVSICASIALYVTGSLVLSLTLWLPLLLLNNHLI